MPTAAQDATRGGDHARGFGGDHSSAAGGDATRGVAAERFRRTLAAHAAGVVVVTGTGRDGAPHGLTATSFSAVSLDPPLVSFYVGRDSTTWPRLRACGHFAVNVLAGDQPEVAARFAAQGVDRFAAPTRWGGGRFGVPLLADVAAHLVCAPYRTIPIGDHELVVGLVVDTGTSAATRPLLYHHGRFGRFLPYDG